MSERDQGKIALEEHFFLPSFEAYGADGSALDGAGKAHNNDPEYFAFVEKRLGDLKLQLEDMDRCAAPLLIREQRCHTRTAAPSCLGVRAETSETAAPPEHQTDQEQVATARRDVGRSS
jgi:hypothetical protein